VPSSKSSNKPKPSLTFEFEAIGTHWSIELIDRDTLPEGLTDAVRNRIAIFDKDYSRFRDDSLVSEMARMPGNYLLPDDAQPMFDLYQDLYTQTGEAVTPLIGQVLVEAGYDARYSLQPKHLHKPPTWEEALDYNFPNLRVKQPALLDVGAVGKGYLIDIVADVVASFGVKDFVVDAGGDMVIRGSQSVRVGLEHPDHTDEVIGVVTLGGQALCGSAGNRRKWANYHHIIDPSKLSSPDHLKAIWVTAESAMLADGLTTALFFMKPAALKKQYQFEYALVNSDNSLEHSLGFQAEFFE
jgi:thiamine biosynthesis lipoprotein